MRSLVATLVIGLSCCVAGFGSAHATALAGSLAGPSGTHRAVMASSSHVATVGYSKGGQGHSAHMGGSRGGHSHAAPRAMMQQHASPRMMQHHAGQRMMVQHQKIIQPRMSHPGRSYGHVKQGHGHLHMYSSHGGWSQGGGAYAHAGHGGGGYAHSGFAPRYIYPGDHVYGYRSVSRGHYGPNYVVASASRGYGNGHLHGGKHFGGCGH
jgi:hypothetical protein